MNILILTTHLNAGGITSYLLTLSRGLIAEGHRVWIVSGGGNRRDEFLALGVACPEFPIKTKSELSPKIYFVLPGIRNLIRSESIDIIHAQTRVTQVMAYFLSRMTGKPFVATCHGFFRSRWFRKKFPCWGDHVIAISPQVQVHLMKDFSVPKDKIAMIPNGIDLKNFTPVDEAQKSEKRREFELSDDPIVGIIARLSDVKGHKYLIDAMPLVLQEVPRARLLIAGEGKEETALKKQIDDLGLKEKILFYRIVNRTTELLPLLDVFVMPSVQEGLGLSVMEAQAAGLPVVASRVGGIPSLIEDGRTGFLVEPENSPALARAIIRVLQNSGDAKNIGRAAREFIQTNFSAGKMVSETIKVYKKSVRITE